MDEPGQGGRQDEDLHAAQRKSAFKGAIILGFVAFGIYVWAFVSQL